MCSPLLDECWAAAGPWDKQSWISAEMERCSRCLLSSCSSPLRKQSVSTVTNHQCRMSSVAGDARYDFINQTRAHCTTPHYIVGSDLIRDLYNMCGIIMRLIHLIMSLDSKNTPLYIYYRVGGQQGEDIAVPANKRTVLSPVEIKTRCIPNIVLHCGLPVL